MVLNPLDEERPKAASLLAEKVHDPAKVDRLASIIGTNAAVLFMAFPNHHCKSGP